MSEQEEKEALEEKTLINQEEETENELKANHFNETSNDESGREGHDDLPIEQDSQTDNCLSKSKSSSVSSDLNHLGTSASTTTVSMSSYELEINRLRELIATRELDYTELEQKLTEHEQQAKQKIEQLHQEYTQKLQQTLKKIESTQKDKYVMKFVEAEKRCIELNKTIQMCTDKLSDSSKEKQRMNERLEKNKLELNKLKEDNEKKHKEIVILTKNFENLKKSVCIYEAREKAAELKLKEEVNSHQMTKRSIEQLNAEISEFRLKLNSLNTSSSSGNQTNAEISEGNENQSQSLTPTSLGSVDECVNSEENLKGQTKLGEIHVKTDLTVKAPELKASISPNPQISTDSKLLKFANEEKERMSRELTALKSQLKDMFEERSKLRDRVHHLDQERKLQDISLANFKETLFKQKEMNKELFTEILQLRELQETLIR
jgi:chromosome segregation ATPase